MESPNKFGSPSSPRSPRKQHAPHSPRALYLDSGSPPPNRGMLRKGESTSSFQERPGSFKESLNDINPNHHNESYRGDASSSPTQPGRLGGRSLKRGESTASFRENDEFEDVS